MSQAIRAVLLLFFILPGGLSAQCLLSPSYTSFPDTNVCGNFFFADPGSGYAAYNWDDGSTGQTLSITASGTYSVSITDTSGCTQADTFEVVFRPRPNALVYPSGSLPLCPNETLTLNGTPLGNHAYLWNTGATDASLTVSTPGSYSIIVYNEFFCSDTSAPVTVFAVPSPQPDLGGDTTVCPNDTVLLDPGADFASWLWPDGSNGQQILVYSPGAYTVTVSDTNGCVASDTIFITEHPRPTLNLGPDQGFCPGTIAAILDAGPNFAQYNWSNGDSSSILLLNQAGQFFVDVVDSNGCEGRSNRVSIYEFTAPAIPQITEFEGLLQTGPQASYQWFLDSLPIPGAVGQDYTPDASGQYQVEILDGNGCPALSLPFDFVLGITKDDIFNGISPNGDHINDAFVIANIERFPDNELIIMNRWGTEVYRTTTYLNDWTGISADGKVLPDGTYYYILDLNNGEEPFTGYLQINR